jgi:hypothetical protein
MHQIPIGLDHPRRRGDQLGDTGAKASRQHARVCDRYAPTARFLHTHQGKLKSETGPSS